MQKPNRALQKPSVKPGTDTINQTVEIDQELLAALFAAAAGDDVESLTALTEECKEQEVKLQQLKLGGMSLLDHAVLNDAVGVCWYLLDPLSIRRQNPQLGNLDQELEAIHNQECGFFFSKHDLLTALDTLSATHQPPSAENYQQLPKIRELVTAGAGLIRFLDVIPRGSIDDEKGKKETSTQLTVFDVLFHYCNMPIKTMNKQFRSFHNDGKKTEWNEEYYIKHLHIVDLNQDDKVMQQFLIELFVRLRWQIIIACQQYLNLRKSKPTKRKGFFKKSKSQGVIWAEDLESKVRNSTTISELLKSLFSHFSRAHGFKGPALNDESLDTIIMKTVINDAILNRYLLTTYGTKKSHQLQSKHYLGSYTFSPLIWSKDNTRFNSDMGLRSYNQRCFIDTVKCLSNIAKKFGVELKIDADKSPDEQVYYWQYQQPTLNIEAKVAELN